MAIWMCENMQQFLRYSHILWTQVCFWYVCVCCMTPLWLRQSVVTSIMSLGITTVSWSGGKQQGGKILTHGYRVKLHRCKSAHTTVIHSTSFKNPGTMVACEVHFIKLLRYKSSSVSTLCMTAVCYLFIKACFNFSFLYVVLPLKGLNTSPSSTAPPVALKATTDRRSDTFSVVLLKRTDSAFCFANHSGATLLNSQRKA